MLPIPGVFGENIACLVPFVGSFLKRESFCGNIGA